MEISKSVKYVGVNDKEIDLFEGQYDVPNGMSYNSYIIIDKKVAVFDSVDENFADEWLQNIESTLGDRSPDYLIVQHMEPDHSGSVMHFAEKYPERVTCQSCKNGGTKSAATAYKNTEKSSSSKTKAASGKEPVSAAMFRKAYDELVAEFSDVLPDVKEYLGGWTSTIVINRSK